MLFENLPVCVQERLSSLEAASRGPMTEAAQPAPAQAEAWAAAARAAEAEARLQAAQKQLETAQSSADAAQASLQEEIDALTVRQITLLSTLHIHMLLLHCMPVPQLGLLTLVCSVFMLCSQQCSAHCSISQILVLGIFHQSSWNF